MTDWRSVGRKLARLTAEQKTALGFSPDMSESELVYTAISKYKPDAAARLDLRDLYSDLDKWKALRARREESAALQSVASGANTKYRAARWLANPVGEAIATPARRAGLIGSEETLGEAASREIGGGTGAFAGGAVDALTDPLSYVAASPKAMKFIIPAIAGKVALDAATMSSEERLPYLRDVGAAFAGGAVVGGLAPKVVQMGGRLARYARSPPAPAPAPVPAPAGARATARTAPPPVQPAPLALSDGEKLRYGLIEGPEAVPSPEKVVRAVPETSRVAPDETTGADRAQAPARATPGLSGEARAAAIGRLRQTEADLSRAKAALSEAKARHQKSSDLQAEVKRLQQNAKLMRGELVDPEALAVAKAAWETARDEFRGRVEAATKRGELLPDGADRVRELHKRYQAIKNIEDEPATSHASMRRGIDDDEAANNRTDIEPSGGPPSVISHASERSIRGVDPQVQAEVAQRMATLRQEDLADLDGPPVPPDEFLLNDGTPPPVEPIRAEPTLPVGRVDLESGPNQWSIERPFGDASGHAAVIPALEKELKTAEPLRAEAIKQELRFRRSALDLDAMSPAEFEQQLKNGRQKVQKLRENLPDDPGEARARMSEAAVLEQELNQRQRRHTTEPGALTKVADVGRSWLGTLHSRLVHEGMPTAARTLLRISGNVDNEILKVKLAFDQLRSMKITEADLLKMSARLDLDERLTKALAVLDTLWRDQYETARRKDPPRGDPDAETLAGVAPREPEYWMKVGDLVEPKLPATNETMRTLMEAGESKSPHLYKARFNEDAASSPIINLDQLEQASILRARSAGTVRGGTSGERVRSAYPAVWKSVVVDELRRRAKPAGEGMVDRVSVEEAREAVGFGTGFGIDWGGIDKGALQASMKKADDLLDSLQAPDLFEAVARDRPESGFSDLIKHKSVVDAAERVIKGAQGMPRKHEEATSLAKSVARGMQLGLSAGRNVYGMMYPAGMAFDQARAQGKGPIAAAGDATKALTTAVVVAAKNLGLDLAHQAKRLAGASDELSPAQKVFGRSRTGAHLAGRAIALTDRAARMGVVAAMKDFVPKMRHDQFAFVDRTLPMSDPKNVEIALKELANDSQGLGTLLDGYAEKSFFKELMTQYASPEIRQLERALPRLKTGGKIVAAAATVPLGEAALDYSAILRGSGLNPPGSEQTEDQKEDPLKSMVSFDRNPDILVRAAQNAVYGIPGAKTAIQAKVWQDVPTFGAAPSASALALLGSAASTAMKTGDWRSFLSMAEYPGLGREWAKVVLFEEDQKRSGGKAGFGRVPQNLSWPFKIQLYLDGKLSAADALKDLVSTKPLPLEARAREHRAKANREAKRRKQKEEQR